MGTLSYPYTLSDTLWFDAVYTWANFQAVQNLINGGLNEDNWDATASPTIAVLTASEEIATNLLEPAGSLEIEIPENKKEEIRLESDPLSTIYMQIDADGVTIP